ncbi:hypothetical protein BDE40_3159 [Litoreibacter halocynthiae]|uniref:Uncharacterized protein n=1 Tax=Litoreibacter halocynthiae TaxID=1242689 RepID=A0A4R7LG99_9RHOB|nr:hypothetical protein [Litoreibacter halocynthiae]TDT72980.1 hypothetical protein BDE40_3159 [Litoreibacter halocynthiae]
MSKVIAILNVIAWSGFWAFGYLALSADVGNTTQMMVAGVLAVLGAGVGLFTYLQLVRHSEATGYAKPRNRVPEHLRENEEGAT